MLMPHDGRVLGVSGSSSAFVLFCFVFSFGAGVLETDSFFCLLYPRYIGRSFVPYFLYGYPLSPPNRMNLLVQ